MAYGTIDKCTITGNTICLSGSGSGIMFSGAVTETSTITVADNTFKNCSQEGGYCVNNTSAVEGEQVAPITVTGSTFIDCANKYLNQVNVEEAATSDTAYVCPETRRRTTRRWQRRSPPRPWVRPCIC